jgi:glycosyltransferase involved in cell wall biosynthesis
VAGLNVTDGDELLTANSPRKLAEHIVKLIRDEKLRRALGENARSFVEEQHDWAPLLQRFVEMLEALAARHGNGQHSAPERLNRSGRR